MQTMTRTQSKIMWKEKHTKNDGGVGERQRREEEKAKEIQMKNGPTLGLIGGKFSLFLYFFGNGN